MIDVSILGIKENKINNYKKLDNSSCDMIHIDIMDNKFVPNYNLYESDYIFNKDHDIHLMVEDVSHYIDKYKYLNPKYITFHIEVKEDILFLINKIKSNNIKVGLAIKPNTDINLIKPYLNLIDLVLVMSVEPGFGGQKYIENSTNRINEFIKLREENNYHYLIEVDGGINNNTFNINNADIKVVGSYITNSDNYEDKINELKNLENI